MLIFYVVERETLNPSTTSNLYYPNINNSIIAQNTIEYVTLIISFRVGFFTHRWIRWTRGTLPRCNPPVNKTTWAWWINKQVVLEVAKILYALRSWSVNLSEIIVKWHMLCILWRQSVVVFGSVESAELSWSADILLLLFCFIVFVSFVFIVLPLLLCHACYCDACKCLHGLGICVWFYSK